MLYQQLVPPTTKQFIDKHLGLLQERIEGGKRLMEIKKSAVAGTLESSDVQIMLSAGNNGLEFELVSDVAKQFGDAIKRNNY